MKRILITGITGYLGSRLAASLCVDFEVYGLARQPIKTTYLPLRLQNRLTLFAYDGSGESVLAALEESRPDIVFHMAAHYTGSHQLDVIPALIESNLCLGCCLMEAMSTVGCRRFVYATTSMAYRQGKGYLPLNLYAATKQAFSDLVTFYTDRGAIDAAGVVLSDTYGPGDQRPKVLNLIRQAILKNEPMSLTSGQQIFDLLYVDDVVNGLCCAAAATENPSASHQFFQLSSQNPRSLKETVELMVKENQLTFHAGWGDKTEPNPQIDQQIKVYPPPPDWIQRVSLEEGVKRFWNESCTGQQKLDTGKRKRKQ